MKASIERGRIRVQLGDDLSPEALAEQWERISAAIGSAKPKDGDLREISLALSVQNFRKLRKLGCKLDTDPDTTEMVARMRKDFDEYEAETRRGNIAKAAGSALLSDYVFKKPPFKHQVLGFNFLHSMNTPALFGDCGTGKTFIVSTWADSLIKSGVPIALLVICPVNLIQHVWIDDVTNFTDMTCVGLRERSVLRVLATDYDDKGDAKLGIPTEELRAARRLDPEWKAKAKRKAVARYNKKVSDRFEQDVNVYIINPENLRNDIKERRVRDLLKRLIAEGKQVVMVIDESSKLKSRVSRTYRSLKRLRSLCSRCIIMTGTPSPNGLLDLWSQFSVLDGGKTLQSSFTDFRHDTCKEVILRGVTWKDKKGATHNATKWHPKPGAAMQVYRTLEPRVIRFKTEDCIDLPPKRFIVRDVEMNQAQQEVYDDMENMLFAELEGEPITAKVAATKLLKLREVTGGFVITDSGDARPLGKDAPKMVELDELLRQSIADKLGDSGPPSKALIWAQYQWECKTLVKRYAAYGARGLFGGISSGAKDDAIRKFKSDPNSRILVCHPASAGHGLTLTEANYAFYYSLSYNFEEFYQSYRRMTRPGQKKAMTYYFLVCPGTIDEELIDAIRAKKNLSDLVTDGRFSREDLLGKRKSRGSQIEISWDTDLPDAGGQPHAREDHDGPARLL